MGGEGRVAGRWACVEQHHDFQLETYQRRHGRSTRSRTPRTDSGSGPAAALEAPFGNQDRYKVQTRLQEMEETRPPAAVGLSGTPSTGIAHTRSRQAGKATATLYMPALLRKPLLVATLHWALRARLEHVAYRCATIRATLGRVGAFFLFFYLIDTADHNLVRAGGHGTMQRTIPLILHNKKCTVTQYRKGVIQ